MQKHIINIFILAALTCVLLFLNFFSGNKGLTHPEGMEYAQLGREVLRGNGLQNKIIRPLELQYQLNRQLDNSNKEKNSLIVSKNTFYAPFFPYVNSAILWLFDGGNHAKHQLKDNQNIYYLDKVLIAFSILYFVITIAIIYLLANSIFNIKVAFLSAVTILVAPQFWAVAQTGLPQAFLILLFTICFALQWQLEQRRQFGLTRVNILLLLALGLLFGIVIITKWLMIWPVIGYFVYLFTLMPHKKKILLLLPGLCLCLVPVLIYNAQQTGSVFGHAFLDFNFYMEATQSKDKLYNLKEKTLRNLTAPSFNLKTAVITIVSSILHQVNSIVQNLGGLLLAPLFFITLLHRFKRDAVTKFSYSIAISWFAAAIGMSCFGLLTLEYSFSANQLHLLFAPIMQVFGIALVIVMWQRFNTKTQLVNLDGWIIAVICIGIFLFTIPSKIRHTFTKDGAERANVPYYIPRVLANDLHAEIKQLSVKKNSLPLIISDQPSAVAWYADTYAIWFPNTPEQLRHIVNLVKEDGNEVLALHTSSISTREFYDQDTYRNFAPLVYDFLATYLLQLKNTKYRQASILDIFTAKSNTSEIKDFNFLRIHFSNKKSLFSKKKGIERYGHNTLYMVPQDE